MKYDFNHSWLSVNHRLIICYFNWAHSTKIILPAVYVPLAQNGIWNTQIELVQLSRFIFVIRATQDCVRIIWDPFGTKQ